MKLRYLSIILASIAGGLHGMQQPQDSLEIRTQNGFMTIPKHIIEHSMPLQSIQSSKENNFFRNYLLSDQSKFIIQSIIRDQEHITAESLNLDKTNSEDLLYCLVVSKRLKLNRLYEAYRKRASELLKK